MFRSNKMHTLIFACTTDNFQKSRKMRYSKNCLKSLPNTKFHVFGVFQDDSTSLLLHVLQFDKTCTENTFFFKKVDFHIFVPKTYKMKEDFSETPLNLSPLKFTFVGKKTFL